MSPKDIARLIEFAGSVPERYPRLQNADGSTVPADIEFGFFQDKLVLFQIRPFLESTRVRQNLFLNRLDQRLKDKFALVIALDEIPAEETP